MKLTIGKFYVCDAKFGDKTMLCDQILTISKDEVRSLVLEDSNIQDVEIDIVRPGEKKRIVHVLDTIEPRIKLGQNISAFPGFLSPPLTVGYGTTYCLKGITVMESAELPWDAGGLLIPREGIVDMVGPGKHYSPFSETVNIVLSFSLSPGKSDIEYDASVRMAGLRVSHYLASIVRGMIPDNMEVFHTGSIDQNLPNVVYVHQVQSQGTYAHTYVYGKDVYGTLPTLLHPNELIDGAVVSANYVYACFKTPTFLHCNNPVVMELYKYHGIRHNFLGVILSRGHNYTFDEKLRSSQFAAKIAKQLNADGAIITWEGGGNSIVEAMQTVKACEEQGIKTVIISYEMGGIDGDGMPLLDSVEQAKAIVSAGSIEKKINLPPLKSVGGLSLRLAREMGGIRKDAGVGLEFTNSHEMYCGANQVGFGCIAARDY
ncbi:MAG: glycine/sarcosine/betaine reductase component B subunit [Tepidanaerobacteraceae bacterium]|jgi:sarcosine reductase